MVTKRVLEPRLAAAAAASQPAWPAPTTITSYSGSIIYVSILLYIGTDKGGEDREKEVSPLIVEWLKNYFLIGSFRYTWDKE